MKSSLGLKLAKLFTIYLYHKMKFFSSEKPKNIYQLSNGNIYFHYSLYRYKLNRGEKMNKIIRIKEMMELLKLSRSCIYQLIKDELLPRSFKVSSRAVGWLQADIQTILTYRSQGKPDQQIRSFVREINDRIDGKFNV